jgi:hypothetical protein
MNDIEKAEKLMNQGFDYLDEYEYDKAIKIDELVKSQ